MVSRRIPAITRRNIPNTILLKNINEFCSTNKNHLKLSKLENHLKKVDHSASYLIRMKGFAKGSNIKKRQIEEIFRAYKECILKCSLTQVQELRRNLILEIERTPFVTFIDNESLTFSNNLSDDLKNRIIQGISDVSFLLSSFLILDRRHSSALLAEEIVEKLGERYINLIELKEDPELSNLEERKELHSEMVLKESWNIIKDIRRALDLSLSKESIRTARSHLKNLLDVFSEELGKIQEYLSDKIVFLLKAKYTQNLPERAKKVVQENLVKISKILKGKTEMLIRMQENPLIQEREELRAMLEDLELTLLYAVQTIPYSDAFTSPEKRFLNDQLRYFSIYASLLRDIEPFDRNRHLFSEDLDLKLHYVPKINGKSLDSVITQIEGLSDDKRVTVLMLRKLYDYLIMDIEMWFQKNKGFHQDRGAVTSLKKWIIFSQVREKIEFALNGLSSLKDSIYVYKEKVTGNSFFLPNELINILKEVCYVFALLLQQEKKLSEIFTGDEYIFLIKKHKSPSSFYLKRTSGIIADEDHVEKMSISEEMQKLLEDFSDLCVEAKMNEASKEFKRFEELIRKDLKEMNFKGSILEALQKKRILMTLMERPWIKNQSWNRNMVMHIVRICKALSFSINPLPNQQPEKVAK